MEQERSFTVKQVAQADRFLSTPLEENYRVNGGRYSFSVGKEEISFEFRGGSLKEFTDALNRRGRGILQSSLVTVRPGTTSLLIESKVTGEENRLGFSGEAAALGEKTGMTGRVNDSHRDFTSEAMRVRAGSSSEIPMNFEVPASGNWILRYEIATELRPGDAGPVSRPPPGPSIPSAGSVSYGGIVIENDSSSVSLPPWTPPEQPRRVDNMGVLSIGFSDGTSLELPPISDSPGFNAYQYNLDAVAGAGKTIVSMSLANDNTHRDVSIRNVQIFDPAALGGVRPLNAVSTAQDAVISMEGIEIRRSGNEIDDLVPGVSLTVRGVSDRPVRLTVEPDREAVKEAIISLVGNYNRLMAEINVVTRNDDRVIDELSYLTREERDDYRQRLGVFSGDSTLMQMRNSLMRVINTPYPTSEEQELALLSQIGIGTDVRRGGASGGFDASRLRGYLEIDESVLDAAIVSKLPAIKELFGSDTTGDLLADTGVAFSLDALTRPYTETSGIIALRTNTINSRIDQERRTILTLDRQLAAKEADLKRQYGQMEGAYRRMEQMSTSLDRFQQQNSNNNR
jgi:flagellar hook-associated protein 2